MKAQTIADVLEYNLRKLNSSHDGVTKVDKTYEHLERIAERFSQNVKKCACTIGDKEFDGSQVKTIELPKLYAPQYEVMTASARNIKGKLVMEIIY